MPKNFPSAEPVFRNIESSSNDSDNAEADKHSSEGIIARHEADRNERKEQEDEFTEAFKDLGMDDRKAKIAGRGRR
jgi:hypothetical protein